MIRSSLLFLFVGGAMALVPSLVSAQNSSGRAADEPPAARQFRAYLEDDWKRWMIEYPEAATGVGFPGQNRRWTDDSPQGIAARKQHLRDSLTKLKSFVRASLPEHEQLNYDLYLELLTTADEGLQYGDDPWPFRNVVPGNLWMPMTQMEGVQQGAAATIANMPNRTSADYEDILARLAALPAFVQQQHALLQEGLTRGYSPPKLMLRDLPKQIADLTPADPLQSALLQPFTEFPAAIAEADRARLTNRAKE